MEELKTLDAERNSYISEVRKAIDAFAERRTEIRAEMSEGLKSLFGISSLSGELLREGLVLYSEEGDRGFTLSGDTHEIHIHSRQGQILDGDLTYRFGDYKPEFRSLIKGTTPDIFRTSSCDSYDVARSLAQVLDEAIDALNEGYELYKAVMLRSEEIVDNLVRRINKYRERTKKDTENLNDIMAKLGGGTAEGDESGEVTIKVEKHREANNLRLVIEIGGLDNEN